MGFEPVSRNYPLVLASSSPRREKLLRQVGLPFRPLPSNLDENFIQSAPPARTRLLAEKKASAVYPMSNKSWVLGADTLVVLGDRILGKPVDHADARAMLSLLSGKRHLVVTGIAVLDPSGRTVHSEAITTLVKIKGLTQQEVDAYVDTEEPFGKAGGYGIQGIAAFMVESISGSYTNVVGLPLCSLIRSLLAIGALKNFPLSLSSP